MDDKFHFTGCIFIWSDGWSRPTWILQNPSSNLSFSWIPGATHGPFRYEIQLKYLTCHDIRIFATICSLCNLSLDQWDSYITGGGLFTLFVSMIGLVATSRRSPCLLRFYAFMLLVAFLVLLGGITCSVKVYLFDYKMAYLIKVLEGMVPRYLYLYKISGDIQNYVPQRLPIWWHGRSHNKLRKEVWSKV